MGIIVWVISGAFAGWLSSLSAKKSSREGKLADIVVGVAGAVLAGYSMLYYFARSSMFDITLHGVCVAAFGAVTLTTLVRSLRR